MEKFGWQSDVMTDSLDNKEHSHNTKEATLEDVSTGVECLDLAQETECNVDTSRIDGGAPGEPTEVDYHGALGEATQMLQSAIVTINDVLEELRYFQHDPTATLNH